MSTFYLVRHGENDLVGGAIAGRSPGVHLNAAGRQQAERLAEHLARRPLRHIFSSPLERARETAEPLARRLNLPVQTSEALIEIDFGDWTRKRIAELDQTEEWRRWNTLRSVGRVPHGESMLEVQARFVGKLESLRRQFPADSIGIFSHGDPLRAAIVYYLGLPLDLLLRLEVSTASVTIFDVDDWSARFQCVNWQLPAN